MFSTLFYIHSIWSWLGDFETRPSRIRIRIMHSRNFGQTGQKLSAQGLLPNMTYESLIASIFWVLNQSKLTLFTQAGDLRNLQWVARPQSLWSKSYSWRDSVVADDLLPVANTKSPGDSAYLVFYYFYYFFLLYSSVLSTDGLRLLWSLLKFPDPQVWKGFQAFRVIIITWSTPYPMLLP